MEIIIGRDPKNKNLLLTVDGSSPQTASSRLVPESIGFQHCKLTINNGQMLLKNLDINNYTYVNGRGVESKIVTQNDKIELGKDHFLLDWSILKSYMPMDIRPLKKRERYTCWQ